MTTHYHGPVSTTQTEREIGNRFAEQLRNLCNETVSWMSCIGVKWLLRVNMPRRLICEVNLWRECECFFSSPSSIKVNHGGNICKRRNSRMHKINLAGSLSLNWINIMASCIIAPFPSGLALMSEIRTVKFNLVTVAPVVLALKRLAKLHSRGMVCSPEIVSTNFILCSKLLPPLVVNENKTQCL